jgi:hypothetical protein
MVYSAQGDIYLEAEAPDGSSELIFADQHGRFQGMCAGSEYQLRLSAAPQPRSVGDGGGGGGSRQQQQRGVTFAPEAAYGGGGGGGGGGGQQQRHHQHHHHQQQQPQSQPQPQPQPAVPALVRGSSSSGGGGGGAATGSGRRSTGAARGPGAYQMPAPSGAAICWGALDVGDFAAAAGTPSGAGEDPAPPDDAGYGCGCLLPWAGDGILIHGPATLHTAPRWQQPAARHCLRVCGTPP